MNCGVEQNLTNGIWALLLGIIFGAGGFLILSPSSPFKEKRSQLKGGLGSLLSRKE